MVTSGYLWLSNGWFTTCDIVYNVKIMMKIVVMNLERHDCIMWIKKIKLCK